MTKFLLVSLVVPSLLLAQDTPGNFKPTQAEAAHALYEQQLAAHRGHQDRLVLPGLVADRKARTVELLTEPTGLQENEIIEFLLIAQNSENGYESLLWSFAKPSDVHRALEFIGLQPGSPINPGEGKFWSDGDPVSILVQPKNGKAFPIEELILDTETEKHLPVEGFVFAGSVKLPAVGERPVRYAADVSQPCSIASIYNEPAVVLDVPRQVNQSEVYGHQVVNPARRLEAGQLLTVVLRPGVAPVKQRGQQVLLAVKPDKGPSGLTFSLAEKAGNVLAESGEVTPVLEKVMGLKRDGNVVYVTLSMAPELPVTDVCKTCLLLAMLENMGAVRINPPSAGQLNLRAFVPSKDWRTPEGRIVQPWELHLAPKNEAVAAELVRYEPKTSDGNISFERQAYAVAQPDGVKTRIETEDRERRTSDRAPMPPALMVYVSPQLTYGQLLSYVSPVLPTHRTVFVFIEKD